MLCSVLADSCYRRTQSLSKPNDHKHEEPPFHGQTTEWESLEYTTLQTELPCSALQMLSSPSWKNGIKNQN